MLKRFRDNLLKFTDILGVEATVLPEGKTIFNATHLSIKKGVVITEGKLSDVADVQKLGAAFNKSIPISLCLNGKGILHKKISDTINDPRKALLALLPNAKYEDFYFQQYVTPTHVFVSVIRKKVLHDLLETFRASNLTVISVTLGPFAIQKLVQLLEVHDDRLDVGGHHLEFNQGKIAAYTFEISEYASQFIKIDQELIEKNLFVAYATAFQTLLGNGSIELEVEDVVVERSETIHKKIFRIAGAGVLVFFLLLLLFNFFLFNHYNSRHRELSSSQAQQSGIKIGLDTLSKKVMEREAFLVNTGWMKSSQLSFYADRIGATIPSSIMLRELSINPVDEQSSRKEKKLIFSSYKINIMGSCKKPVDLNGWIQNIRTMDWVASVEMQNYAYDNKENKGVFLLTILIK